MRSITPVLKANAVVTLLPLDYHENTSKLHMKEKSINDWHNTDSIDWEIYWEQIDTLDWMIKWDRNPKRKSSGGWRWPESNYNAPDIFRERFHLDGQVKKSYGEIAQTINLLTTNADKFVSGIIQSMLRRMEHPYRRRMWDLNYIIKLSFNWEE